MASTSMEAFGELQNQSGFGAKLMQQMGWKAGEGLGKDGQGRKSIVTVTKREDGIGLGVGSVDTADHSIKEHRRNFAAIASKIVIPQSSDDDSDDSSSEDRSLAHLLLRGRCMADPLLFRPCSRTLVLIHARRIHCNTATTRKNEF